MTGGPVDVIYRDGALRPAGPFWAKRIGKEFAEGERYRVAEVHDRSTATHNHYFAWVASAWETLPEHLVERYNSPDALRKYALIRSGWCDSESIVCSSPEEAHKVAAFCKGASDEFVLIDVRDNVVTRYAAKSQSYRAMGRDDFARSKEDVLRVIADMLEVKKEDLKQ